MIRPASGFRALTAILASAALLGVAGPAAAQSALGGAPIGPPEAAPLNNPFPAALPGQEQPDFRYQSNLAPETGIVPGPGTHIVPRISLGEEFTDNVFQTESDRRWDLINLISPGIAISSNTPKLKLSLNYNPIFRIYDRNSSQNSVGQELLGVANAVIVPDEFYINARTTATELPRGGGQVNFNFGVPTVPTNGFGFGQLGLSKNNLTQVVSSSITPYYLHRFGTFGTGKLGVRLSQSYASNTSGQLIGSPTGPATTAYTGEGVAQFTSGDDWGRFVYIATLDASKTTGTGVNNNSNRALVDNRIGYVINTQLLVFSDAGWESIHFNNLPNTTNRANVDDGIWGVGASYVPNSSSRLILEYGHREGVTAFRALARYAPTSRIVLTARYTVGLVTDLQSIENRLEQVAINPLGNPVNFDTGAPAFLVNSLNGINNTVSQNHQLTATATVLLDRDTIAFTYLRQYQVPVASTTPGPLVNNTSNQAILTWRHEISIRTSMTSSLAYGIRTVATSPQEQNEQFFSATARLRHFFTDKLSGTALYSFQNRTSNVPGQSEYTNIVLVALTRTF